MKKIVSILILSAFIFSTQAQDRFYIEKIKVFTYDNTAFFFHNDLVSCDTMSLETPHSSLLYLRRVGGEEDRAFEIIRQQDLLEVFISDIQNPFEIHELAKKLHRLTKINNNKVFYELKLHPGKPLLFRKFVPENYDETLL